MDKRTLTAILLMVILYMVFSQFVWKPQQLQKQQLQASQQEATPAVPAAPIAAADSVIVQAPVDSLFISDAKQELVQLSNGLMTVYFNTKGGNIQQVELKNFLSHDKQPVHIIPEDSSIANLKLIHPGTETPLATTVFQHHISTDSLFVSFFLGDPASPQVEKRYSIDNQYGIALDVSVSGFQAMNGIELDFSSGIADTERINKSKSQDYKFLLYADNQIQKTALSKFKKAQPNGSLGSFSWAAVRSKYFAIALKESDPSLMRNYSTGVNKATGNPYFMIDSRQASAQQSWNQSFTIYAGPADYEILKQYGKQMDNIPERGVSWLRWLANIFAWFLKFLHRYIKNYGVVLLIFAFVMKLILHPLTHKQMEHGFKQQKLQPQLQQIQKLYANDKVKQQQEMNKLYKENNTSPLAGCLPVLIQFPIIIPLYNVLRYSLDMRNASFVFWLKDLSEPDPYLILPIVMGAFMIVQSLMMRPPKMDDSQMDDKQKAMQSQQKMMTWMMPIMMFFIFKGMPAGLVLYWTAFNVLSIVHQYYLNQHFKNKDNQ
ncbi:MAG: preprotein translocase YidC [Candidatus Cloacimonetes bacterium HGW-Cloacimonetes-3]|jgi:YidC/Oxa1 family membrane protein insertase|nr:MAG: preprotein translocase YidC [Candidatus Cloacimonetes bacterium HGW-Cloacimonetes-3]